MRDHIQKHAFLIEFRIQLQLLADAFHHRLLIFRIINSKVRIITKPVNIPAQDPHTGRMKCTDPDALRTISHDLIYTFPHLSGRLIGKCNSQNIPRIHPAFIDQMSDPIGEHSRLARSGTRQDQKRSIHMQHRFLLLSIQ